jgi:hypothetical protein
MDRFKQAQTIMHKFALPSGLFPVGANQSRSHRYLWTDAFAVCNYLGFYRQSAQPVWLQQVKDLVAQVHQTFGQHRPQGGYHGWLSPQHQKPDSWLDHSDINNVMLATSLLPGLFTITPKLGSRPKAVRYKIIWVG